jgi:hypothetical protein
VRGLIPRPNQQIGGALIAAVSGGFTAWGWYTLLTAHYYYPKASVIFPAFLVIGVGLVLFPGYREERLARGEDISRLSGNQLITPRWWAILGVALAAGFGNYAVMAIR